MPQKFLSVKNFEIYQHYKKRNPPWFKMYKSIYGDKEFQKLSVSSRYLYTGLLMLATECCNRIDNDATWIGKRLDIPATEVDLRPLYKRGFLLASNASRLIAERLHKTETETESETETETEERESKKPARAPEIVIPEEWFPTESHRKLASARGLDLAIEAAHFKGKAQEKQWTTVNWNLKFTNWLLQEIKFKQRRST